MSANEFSVTFWGVRGSISCPGPDYVRYGGNTPCLEVRAKGRRLIFDAGSGLRPLGETLGNGEALDLDLYLTHTHVDHIQGLPFFRPMFAAGNSVRIWAGHLTQGFTLRDVLCRYMAAPLFPVPPEIFAADVSYHDFPVGSVLKPAPGLAILTAPLNHPNGATAYRVECDGKSICYVTDTEHVEGKPDENVLRLIKETDLFIYDTSYSQEEYENYRGWGHSTWQEAVRLADMAGVKTLVLFHHDPSHKDPRMDEIAADAAKARPGTLTAREGQTLTL